MTQNVLISWAWHLVYIVAGMLLPPMINRQLHQETLGIWYFAWGLVNYFGLLSLGVMGTVSRYVARYRAVRDAQNMNNTVRTGLLIYLCTGAAVLGLTILAVALLPSVFGSRLAGHVLQAQWVVLLLGLSLVVEFVFGVFQSILTGCYRFGTQHAITSGVYILAAGGMIVSLLAGAGLQTMAGIAVMEKLIAGILRMAASYRFCDGLRISTGTVSLRFTGELLRFGFKSILASVSRILTYQTPAILIMTCLGPGPLALYGPAAALVRHVDMLVSKFANVFTPTASALDAQGGKESLRELFVKGTQYGLYTSLPMVAVLVFLGGTILPLWMREETYRQGATVLTILATREGTSVTVIDNKRDAFQAGRTWGQRLFFNQKGQRASLTGERLSDYESRRYIRPSDGRAPVADSQEALNMVLLIQVPLKQKKPMRFHQYAPLAFESAGPKTTALRRSDVEAAVIGHGRVEGPFTEIDNLDIERDPRFPIRVTVQFYKATSNGAVAAADMAQIARQIKRVYDDADYVGSLVTAPDIGRPTEHDGPKTQPRGWWHSFWHRNRKNTGQSRGDALRMLRELRGRTWGQELARALKRIEK